MDDPKQLTNAQWHSLISSITSDILKSEQSRQESTKTTTTTAVHASTTTNKSNSSTARLLAQTIDHTLLKLDATEQQVKVLCEEARRWGFKVRFFRLLVFFGLL